MTSTSPWRSVLAASVAAGAMLLAGCAGDAPTDPAAGVLLTRAAAPDPLAVEVRQLAAGRGITPLARPPRVR